MVRMTARIDTGKMSAQQAVDMIYLFHGGGPWLADRLGLSSQCVWEWHRGLRPIPARWNDRIKAAAAEAFSWVGGA